MEFANDVCRLIFEKNNFNLDDISYVGSMRNYFENNIRNMYENIQDIPLFELYDLKENGADNYGFTAEAYNQKIEYLKEKCIKLYKQ